MGRKYAKDPKAPKRPPSGYFLFMGAARPMILKSNPALKSNVAEIGKACGEAWRQLSEAEKAPYTKKAAAAKAKYDKKNAKYRASKGYQKWLAGKKEFMKANKGLKEKKKLKKMLKNMPKRASSAYFLFANDKRASVMQPGKPIGEVGKQLGQMWQAVYDATRSRYQKKADAAKVKAAKAMAKYKKGREYKRYLQAVADFKQAEKAARKAARKAGKA